MFSSQETKNHIALQFELSYDKGSELIVCVMVTLDKGVTDQPNKENKAST
jgi:hypothetical protein